MTGSSARATATVDLGAVAHNVGILRACAPAAELCAVVKADGYGHGAAEAAAAAIAAGATWLAVAHPAEGAALRAAGLGGPILLLSEPLPDEVAAVVAAELRVAVYTAATIERLAATGARLQVHLKVDTGMNRVGAHPDDVVALALAVERAPNLDLEGVWTHCAVADEPDDAFTAHQLERFDDVLGQLRRTGVEPPLRHAANSAGTIAHPASHFDLVRPGIALYGIPPSPALVDAVELRPALRLTSVVAHVKRVRAGETISYGRHHRFVSDTIVATVPIGYADGIPRGWGLRGGRVLVGGRPWPIVGVVTMDQLMIDLGPAAAGSRTDDSSGDGPGSDVQIGDEVVLIGEQGGYEVTADDLAAATNTIGYEVVTGLGRRVVRRYVDAG